MIRWPSMRPSARLDKAGRLPVRGLKVRRTTGSRLSAPLISRFPRSGGNDSTAPPLRRLRAVANRRAVLPRGDPRKSSRYIWYLSGFAATNLTSVPGAGRNNAAPVARVYFDIDHFARGNILYP